MAKTATTRKDPGLAARMSGDGHVMPEDAAGLIRYWKDHGGGGRTAAITRTEFIATVRHLLDVGKLPQADRAKLVAAGFTELGRP